MLAAKVHATCVYFLTRSYTIHSIGGDWNDFAHENNAPGLTSDSVIGHSLWDYISDPAVMHFYSGAVKAVLNYGKPISIPFRRAAPDWRRSMKLRLIRSSRELCEVICTTSAMEPRPWMELLDDTIERSDFWLPICSWCKPVGIDDSRWIEVEDAANELNDNVVWPLPKLVHVTYPECQTKLGSLY